MKRKLYIVTMSLLLIMSLSLSGVFADVKPPSKINSAEQLKSMLSDNMTEAEVSEIASQTDEDILNEFLMEKLDEAADTLLGQEQQPEMNLLPDGTAYGVQEYDLGDGCVLTVELTDTAEKGTISSMFPMAPVVQPDQWKAYGNRSFTAKATATVAGVSASMSLTHHYTLSAQGIESDKGIARDTWTKNDGAHRHFEPVISDRYAKTPGASDVNMSCNYIFSTPNSSFGYKLNTTVGYVAIDKSAKKIKVRHSWDLSKI